jgi:hypothetical protein
MYDVNKIDIATMGKDRYMVTVVGWMVLEKITMVERGVEKKQQMAIDASE